MHRQAVFAHMMKNISDIHPVKIFVHKFFPLIFYILHFTFYLILCSAFLIELRIGRGLAGGVVDIDPFAQVGPVVEPVGVSV